MSSRLIIFSAFVLLVVLDYCHGLRGFNIRDYSPVVVSRKSNEVQDQQVNVQKKEPNSCACKDYNCGCCAHVDIERLKLNDTGCVNLTYLPDQYGVSLTFSIDGTVYYNETISAKNPPPMCFEVPHLRKYASLCLRLYDLDIQGHQFSGCVDVEARLSHVFVEKVKLGCFHIGKKKRSHSIRKIENQIRRIMVV